MFWSKNKANEAETPLVLMLEKPIRKEVITMDKERITAYTKLCKEIDFLPQRLVDQQLLLFFEERKMKIFDYDEVCKYMSALAEKEKHTWCWRALRPKDKIEGYHWKVDRVIFENKESRIERDRGYYHCCDSSCRPYNDLIPSHVLLNVKEIEKAFPGDQLKFLVTDIPDFMDPFIGVRGAKPDGKLFIFDVWDEPGFGSLELTTNPN